MKIMTYQVCYGDAVAMRRRDRHLDEWAHRERFSTEHEAFNRARDLLDQDFSTVVTILDAAGNEVTGVSLQLRLGYSSVE